jgi:hypothetical protein
MLPLSFLNDDMNRYIFKYVNYVKLCQQLICAEKTLIKSISRCVTIVLCSSTYHNLCLQMLF